MLITSQLSESSLELLEDDQEVSTVNLLSFVDRQEWDVREIVETIPDVRSREFSHVKHRFPILTVRTYALRKAGFFVWNVLVVMVREREGGERGEGGRDGERDRKGARE